MLRLDGHDPPGLACAAEIVRAGGLVAFPTESYYALAASADSAAALARLTALKERPAGQPIALVGGDLAAVARAWAIPEAARASLGLLTARFWPGPLTLILPAAPGVQAELCGPDGVGVRVSGHALARGLAAAVGGLITATSCNVGGAPPVRTSDAIDPILAGGIDAVLAAESTAGGLPSTLLAWHGGRWLIRRAGPVSRAELGACLGATVGSEG